MGYVPWASNKIQATAGWLVLLAGSIATGLLFISRLGFLQAGVGESFVDESAGSVARALSDLSGFLPPLALGHFVGLSVLWFSFSKTAVPRRLRHISRLGAGGSVGLVAANFPSIAECVLCLVAHGANLAFWLLLESNRERRSVWDHARRTTDPLHPYATAFAAAAAILIAVERGRELQLAGSADSRTQNSRLADIELPVQGENKVPTETTSDTLRSPPSEATSDAAKLQSAPTAGPDRREVAFPEQLRQASLAATVRIINHSEPITGSGTIVLANPDFACILTAAHLVRFGDEISIDVFEGDQLRIRRAIHDVHVWGLDPKNDLAMLWVSGDARLRAAVQIRTEEPAASRGADVAVLALTCADDGPPTFYFETTHQRVVRKRTTAEPVPIWEGERIGLRGQSGGALIDQQGFLIGVRSGIAGGKAYYAHRSAIHRFLQSGEYYRESAGRDGPPTHQALLRPLVETLGQAP